MTCWQSDDWLETANAGPSRRRVPQMIEEVTRRCHLRTSLSDGTDAPWILRCRHECAFAFRCSSARKSILECELICARQACVEVLHSWRPLRASCRRLLGVFWSSHVCSVSGSGDHCFIAAIAPPAVTAPETQSSLHVRQWSSASRLLQAAPRAALFVRPLQLSRPQRWRHE